MMSVLQSITMTLSDVQEQLSIMQEHNDLRDSILKKVEKDVADLKKEIPKETPKLKQGRKSPRGLSVSISILMDVLFFVHTGMCA